MDSAPVNEGVSGKKRVYAHLLKELCGFPEDERIADPVEPIFPDLLLLRHLRVERIRVDVRGNSSRVERRIEVRDIDGIG